MSLTAPFQMLGDPSAAACVGDVCEIPQAATATQTATATQSTTAQTATATQPTTAHPETTIPAPETPQAVVNQQLDEDRV